jgi:hypothetical protein
MEPWFDRYLLTCKEGNLDHVKSFLFASDFSMHEWHSALMADPTRLALLSSDPALFKAQFMLDHCPQVRSKESLAEEALMNGKARQHDSSIPLEEYIRTFLHFSNRATAISDHMKCQYFLRGLHRDLRAECLLTPTNEEWKSLSALIAHAQRENRALLMRLPTPKQREHRQPATPVKHSRSSSPHPLSAPFPKRQRVRFSGGSHRFPPAHSSQDRPSRAMAAVGFQARPTSASGAQAHSGAAAQSGASRPNTPSWQEGQPIRWRKGDPLNQHPFFDWPSKEPVPKALKEHAQSVGFCLYCRKSDRHEVADCPVKALQGKGMKRQKN